MEREKRGREKREGRREGRGGGGEMRKIIGIMMIVLLMVGCGQQTDASGGKSLSKVLLEVGRSTEKAFYTFLELVSDTLGFRVNAETKRSEVGSYFSNLGKKIGEASGELEKVAENAVAEVDKDGILNKTIRGAVDVAKATLNALKGHLEALNGIGDDNKVVEVAASQSGVAADETELKKAYNALKGIVEIAKEQKVEDLKGSSLTLQQASIGVTDAKNGAKILATDAAGAAVGDKAALIVSAVRGEEMLAEIVSATEDKVKAVSANATADTTALEFAMGGTAANVSNSDQAKAGAVSGGIALRALVKAGKLASHSDNDNKAVQSAGISAVNKLLVSVEDVVKKTVKKVIEKAKIKIDEGRKPKTAE